MGPLVKNYLTAQAVVVNAAATNGASFSISGAGIPGLWEKLGARIQYTPGTAGNVITFTVQFATDDLVFITPTQNATIVLSASGIVQICNPGFRFMRLVFQSTGTAGPNDTVTVDFSMGFDPG